MIWILIIFYAVALIIHLGNTNPIVTIHTHYGNADPIVAIYTQIYLDNKEHSHKFI